MNIFIALHPEHMHKHKNVDLMFTQSSVMSQGTLYECKHFVDGLVLKHILIFYMKIYIFFFFPKHKNLHLGGKTDMRTDLYHWEKCSGTRISFLLMHRNHTAI